MATRLVLGINDLASANPQLSSEWDYGNNGGLRPEDITTGSSKKVNWIGTCGHRWAATVASRNSGHGCPICAKKTRE